MGLRRRVTIGFMSIVGVLILSGMVSFFELSTLSNDTDHILNANRRSRELAGEMLAAIRGQNRAFVQMLAFNDRSQDSLSLKALDELDHILIEARTESQSPEIVDSMIITAKQMRYIVDKFITVPTLHDSQYELLKSEFPQIDSISNGFKETIFMEYQPVYQKLVTSIDDYMTMSQNSLAPGAMQLQNNAYRAVTPVFISLVVMIATVLMLFYFMMTFCIRPIVAINQSIKDSMTYKVPYAPKCQKKDEIAQLSERVESLIALSRKTKE